MPRTSASVQVGASCEFAGAEWSWGKAVIEMDVHIPMINWRHYFSR